MNIRSFLGPVLSFMALSLGGCYAEVDEPGDEVDGTEELAREEQSSGVKSPCPGGTVNSCRAFFVDAVCDESCQVPLSLDCKLCKQDILNHCLAHCP